MTAFPFPPTRAAGLARLRAFLPRAGRAYAETRHEDRGPGARPNVSMLSPYLRHRLVEEREAVAAALERHGPDGCGKFVQEVLWRTYWKGWLELRPEVWTRYRADLAALAERRASDPALDADLAAAEAGRTGIDCFDAWIGELAETGYLHNYARMWFASIWIFTLRLPWQAGADLFLRRLLDGDPASNTLSWRWVAGLHTRGKTYLARADAIARSTDGRFSPKGLATIAPALDEPPPPPPRPLPRCEAQPAGPVALLLTPEDLRPESLPVDGLDIRAVAAGGVDEARASGPRAFAAGALADGLGRAGEAFAAPVCWLPRLDADLLAELAEEAGVRTLVTAYTPVGPVAERLAAIEPDLAARGVRLARLRRSFDTRAWPRAMGGYFAFREGIPDFVEAEGLMPRTPDLFEA